MYKRQAVGGKVRRNDVHVVSGADCFFLFLNLHLDALDGLRLIDGADMEVDGDVAVHIKDCLLYTSRCV